jgi:hypothetical protein
MADRLEDFVASLSIPPERREVVLAELRDHEASAREHALREGRDADLAAREALGDLEALRRSLEAVEPAFRVTRAQAFTRGVVAAVLVAGLIDRGGALMAGLLGCAIAVAIVIALAPPRTLLMLRGELAAPSIPGMLVRGPRIGPALTYLFTVLSGPYVVWVGLIFALRPVSIDVPLSAWAVAAAVSALLIVETLRRRAFA